MRDNVGLWFWARPHNNALAFSYLSSCDCFGFFELQLATLKGEITCETVTSVSSFLCSPQGLTYTITFLLTTFTCLLNLTCDQRAESASSSAVYISGGISNHKKMYSQFVNL